MSENTRVIWIFDEDEMGYIFDEDEMGYIFDFICIPGIIKRYLGKTLCIIIHLKKIKVSKIIKKTQYCIFCLIFYNKNLPDTQNKKARKQIFPNIFVS